MLYKLIFCSDVVQKPEPGFVFVCDIDSLQVHKKKLKYMATACVAVRCTE